MPDARDIRATVANLRALLSSITALAQRPLEAPLPVETTPTALDVIYQAAMIKIDQQKREVDFLDTKAIGILTAASLIVTVAPAFRLAGRAGAISFPGLALLLIAAVAYGVLMWRIRAALQERDFDFPPSPTVLRDDWPDATPTEVKAAIVEAIANRYTTNREQIRHKATALGDALWLLLAESLTLTLGLSLS